MRLWQIIRIRSKIKGGEYKKYHLYVKQGMLEQIRQIDPLKVSSDPGVQQILYLLLHELAKILHQYWEFYGQLRAFKELPADEQKIQKNILEAKFDQIFTQVTIYDSLNIQIQRTFAKKKGLLLVLDYPFLPLHNNSAELAVRTKVRKRDISFHTMSRSGTQIQDAYTTLVHTATKLGVSAFDYIKDRVSNIYNLHSLADMIKTAYNPSFATLYL